MTVERQASSERALQIVADDNIRTAIKAGEFDNLPDLGRTSAIIDEPYDPYRWSRRKLRREGLPPLLRGE